MITRVHTCVSLTGKTSYGHMKPVHMMAHLIELLKFGLNYFGMNLVIYFHTMLGGREFYCVLLWLGKSCLLNA